MARRSVVEILNEGTNVRKEEEVVVIENSTVDNLETAANLLLDQLVPSVKNFSIEVADIVLKIPRWQLLCGSLLAQFESGGLPAPSIDPAWQNERRDVKRTCERCGEEFDPFKPFQKYCSNECGVAAMKATKEVRA